MLRKVRTPQPALPVVDMTGIGGIDFCELLAYIGFPGGVIERSSDRKTRQCSAVDIRTSQCYLHSNKKKKTFYISNGLGVIFDVLKIGRKRMTQ